jgi:hypothetical protein
MMNPHRVFHVIVVSVLVSSCSATLDADRVQCTNDADCTKRGGKFAKSECVDNFCEAVDAWSCSEHEPLAAKSSKSVAVDFTLFDAVSMKTVGAAEASLCGKLDLECTAPMTKVTTGADGVVHFDVPQLFDGYVQLKAEGYDSTMMFLPPSLVDLSLGQFPLTTMVATAVLGSQLGKPLLPGTGRVLTTITGCDMNTTEGVVLQGENMGEDAEGFYAVGGFPSFTATSTDNSGFAGFVNVTPGSVTLNAELENGRRVGRAAIFVRADYVSVRRIQPWTD